VFQSLDFLYVPTRDVGTVAQRYLDELGVELVWQVRAMGTVVACLRPAADGPLVLLTDHIEGDVPILIYRVDDYDAVVTRLRAAGTELRELEIPHGPCASFRAPGGQRAAVYELTRPQAAHQFDGRIDD
jgi:hypothetical protein